MGRARVFRGRRGLRVRDWLRVLRSRERRFRVGALIQSLADAVHSFDRQLLDLVQTPHAGWLDLLASIVSIFGQAEVTEVVALAVAIVWWRARRPRWWLPLLIAAVVAIATGLKLIVPPAARPLVL